jgi:hypothetical protein
LSQHHEADFVLLYVINLTSLDKSLTLQQLATDLVQFNRIAIVTETFFISQHTQRNVYTKSAMWNRTVASFSLSSVTWRRKSLLASFSAVGK